MEPEQVGVDLIKRFRNGNEVLPGDDDDGGIFASSFLEGLFAVVDEPIGGVVHAEGEGPLGNHVDNGAHIFNEVLLARANPI